MAISLFPRDTYVGIDIGSHSLKAVQIDPSGRSFTVTRVGQYPTPPETVRDGVAVDPEQLGHAIRQLLRDSDISASTANIAVAGSSVIVRTIKIPKMSEAVLRKSIKFEAGKYVPSSVGDSYIEFDILGDAEEGKMDVLVVAAPKEMVESRIRAVAEGGLDTEVVDIEGFAIYRSLIECQPDSDYASETIGLVDMGAGHTHISIVSNGQFALTRSIPIAGSTLTDALQTYFRTGPEEADRTKSSLDFGLLAGEGRTAADNPALHLLQPVMDELVRELRRSINYYQTQQTEATGSAPVSTLLLTGGTARLQGIGDYLGFKLGLPCESLGVWETERFRSASADARNGVGHEFGVAAGLAMRRAGRAMKAA
jgi:type IV pilus assembly protein PilM